MTAFFSCISRDSVQILVLDHDWKDEILRYIEALSARTGVAPESIVKQAMYHFANYTGQKATTPSTDRLDEVIQDPAKVVVFLEVMSAMGQRSANQLTPEQRSARASKAAKTRSRNLTAAQRKARASDAGQARANKLSPERRKEIATKASMAAKKKRDEKS